MDDQDKNSNANPATASASSQSTSPTTPDPLSSAHLGNHAHKFIFGYIALIILVFIVAGVYNWQHTKVVSLNKENASLSTQITNLDGQLKNLNKEISVLKGAKPSSSPTTSTTGSAQDRNMQRQADVLTILNAVYQYTIDDKGNLPSSITTTRTPICATSTISSPNCAGLVDLSVLTAQGKYLVAIPKDPVAATATNTGYDIVENSNSTLTVSAPAAEAGIVISVTR